MDLLEAPPQTAPPVSEAAPSNVEADLASLLDFQRGEADAQGPPPPLVVELPAEMQDEPPTPRTFQRMVSSNMSLSHLTESNYNPAATFDFWTQDKPEIQAPPLPAPEQQPEEHEKQAQAQAQEPEQAQPEQLAEHQAPQQTSYWEQPIRESSRPAEPSYEGQEWEEAHYQPPMESRQQPQQQFPTIIDPALDPLMLGLYQPIEQCNNDSVQSHSSAGPIRRQRGQNSSPPAVPPPSYGGKGGVRLTSTGKPSRSSAFSFSELQV